MRQDARGGLAVERLPEIDWLRGLAALGVFLFHAAGVCGFPKRTLPPIEVMGRSLAQIPSLLTFGATGVDLFFVLSGFCLALQQWRDHHDGWTAARLRQYTRHRVARIVPAYWAACGLSLVVMLSLGEPAEALWWATSTHLLFLHGFVQAHFLALNGALWSMATEAQFYVVFPLVFALYRRGEARLGSGWWWLLFVGLAFVLTVAIRGAIAAAGEGPIVGEISRAALLQYQLPGRLLEFCAGIAVADLFFNKRVIAPRWLLAAVCAALTPFGLWARALGPSALVDPALGLMYGALLAALLLRPRGGAAGAGGRLSRALRGPGAAFGRSSYSFFLVHVPILLAVAAAAPMADAGPWSRFLVVGGVGLALSLVVGTGLYVGVELPLWRRLRGR
jgi:peptidoglycan/LPS O-acetylase OafA/YrhL